MTIQTIPKLAFCFVDEETKTLFGWWFGNVWNRNFMTFHSVGNVIIPTDEVIFFRGIETTNQLCSFIQI
jgi:hypothetical protein